mmetsp:Transcript_15428/g.40690  ORF Transcript_15428/g.40690 Transcript_15428/m.40690 type:complete len:87 (+) Transcript_15428:662-922(+)
MAWQVQPKRHSAQGIVWLSTCRDLHLRTESEASGDVKAATVFGGKGEGNSSFKGASTCISILSKAMASSGFPPRTACINSPRSSGE